MVYGILWLKRRSLHINFFHYQNMLGYMQINYAHLTILNYRKKNQYLFQQPKLLLPTIEECKEIMQDQHIKDQANLV